jgi:polyphosphate kinase
MKRLALNDPRYYFNRHVPWLEFNRRVLPPRKSHEAGDCSAMEC